MKMIVNRPMLAALFLVLALVITACGGRDEAVPTDIPAEPTVAATDTAAPEPTATEVPEDTPEPTEEPVATEPASEEPADVAAEEEAYPPPEETSAVAAEEAAYPPPATTSDSAEPEAYPPPVTPTEETSSIPIVPFVLDRPIEAGATLMTGTGPAGVPILAVNVTFMGELLGETVVGEDGIFEIAVPALEENTWVGIALADLEGTDLTLEDFRASGFRGEGASQVPQVGFVYDSATVGK